MVNGVSGYVDFVNGTYGITFRVYYSQTYNGSTNESVVSITNVEVKSTSYTGQYFLDGTFSIDGIAAVNMSAFNGTHYVNINSTDTFYAINGDMGSVTVAHDENYSKTVTIVQSNINGYYNNSVKWTAYTNTDTIELTKIGGFIYIDNGTSFDMYEVYIDNGTSWDLYMPYIDNGTSWDICG